MKHIQIASIKKRLLSSLIDLTLIAGLFCLFYFLVFTKAVASVQNYDHLNQVITMEKLKSNLYFIKDNKVISYLQDDHKAGEDKLSEPTKLFYTQYIKHNDGENVMYWYHTHILFLEDKLEVYKDKDKINYPEVTLFEWTDETYTEVKHKDDFDQETFNQFYRSSYASALATLQLTNPTFNAIKTMTWGNIRAAMYSSMLATFIPCFIVPISLKNGKTVGKLVTKLVVLTDDGYEYKRYKHIFRYLAFYGLEVFGGVVTIGLTLILTTSLAFFTRKKRALHDYVAFSVVVDETNSVFYKDEEEEKTYLMKSQEKLI